MKKISIIIPCHNCSEWVLHNWKSLKEQSIGIDDLECIYVDDASNDDGKTWDSLNRIKNEKTESVVIVRLKENRRQGGARNVGLQHVTGKYILFLDADDMYRPETCKELYDLAEEEKADIIQFDCETTSRSMDDISIPDREKNDEYYTINFENNEEIRKTYLSGYIEPFSVLNKLYLSELVTKVNSHFAEHKVYEEPLFVYPLFFYVKKMQYTSAKYLIWRRHENSTMAVDLGPKINDHIAVQLELLEDIKKREALYIKYKKEVDFHFFYSYYLETLIFSRWNRGAFLSLDVFRRLQDTVRKECNNIYLNRYYIAMKGKRLFDKAVRSVYSCFDSQEILDAFLDELFHIWTIDGV